MTFKQSSEIIQVIESMGDAYWEFNPSKALFCVSDKVKVMLGYENEELTLDLESWLSIVEFDDLQVAHEKYNQLLSGAIEAFHAELRVTRKDGT
jgi:PAS domain S-box-containing protein